MITLTNGRGQLGEALQKEILRLQSNKWPNFIVYHTWDVWNKEDEIIQKKCFTDFVEFFEKNKYTKTRVVFISTASEKVNHYTHYKRSAESYLFLNSHDGIVIHLPTLIGKGVCQNMRDKTIGPYGVMELISVKNAAIEVTKILENGFWDRFHRVVGTKIPAHLAYDLINL